MDVKEALLTEDAAHRHPWERARRYVIHALIRSALPDPANCTGAVLEVGCGDAYVLRSLAENMPHARLVGVDTSLTEELIRRFSGDAPSGRFSLHADMSSALERCMPGIDVVLLLDVLEHVSDENAILAPLRACARAGSRTVFIVTAPAFDFLFSKHDRFLGHFRRYSRRSLERRLAECGLRAIKGGSFFFSLFIIRSALVLIEKNVSRTDDRESKGIGGWKGVGLFDDLMVLCLRFDFLITRLLQKCGISLPGLSVYAQCLKQPS